MYRIGNMRPFRHWSEGVLALPSPVTAGGMHICWDEADTSFCVTGWADFPKTTDLTLKLACDLPSSFPGFATRNYPMSVPCLTDGLGFICGYFDLVAGTRQIVFSVPFVDIVHVYMMPITYGYDPA